jgi:Flp pilus assembly protein TadD
VLSRRNDIAGASAVFDEATKANPRNDALAEVRAQWLSETRQTDLAISAYETLLKKNPGNNIAANNLAYLLAEAKGDKASLDRALVLSERFEYTNQPGWLDTLGWTHYKLGQVADALPLLQRAQALEPQAALFQLHYGLALYKSGDVAKAKEHLRSAAGASKQPLPDEAQRIIQQG